MAVFDDLVENQPADTNRLAKPQLLAYSTIFREW